MGDKLIKWCNHNACRIRDKAQRPSAFKSQPCGRLTCSTPELGAQFQPHRETKKESDHTCKACPVAWSWKKRWSQAQRHVVQHIDVDRWDLEKRPTISHYLDELPIQKCQFRQKKRWSQARRHTVQHIDIDRWESKKGQQFTLLRRITNSKVKIQTSFYCQLLA